VVSGPPAIQSEFRRIIDRLDVRRPQVLIEGAIAEISADTAKELGIQWAAGDDNQAAAGTSFRSAGSGSLANIINNVQSGNTPNPGSGLSLGIADLAGNIRFGALLRALASDTDNNILSTPSLLTLDNQEAEIKVAENVPFLTGQFNPDAGGNDGNGTNPFQTIERQDVGIILNVEPQINDGDSVSLAIEQEVSSLKESSQAVDLITSKRTIDTEVLVDDGQLIMLGGLLDETVSDTEERVPLLGSIPGLGRLFRYNTTSRDKQNLMVFLRPHIIRSKEDLSEYSEKKYSDMRSQQLAQRRQGLDLLPDEQAPVLPDLGKPDLPAPYERDGAALEGQGSNQGTGP